MRASQDMVTAPIEVVKVSIDAGLSSLKFGAKKNFDTPLDRFKTAKGIGIGSTAAKLKHAYPHLKKPVTGLNWRDPARASPSSKSRKAAWRASRYSMHLG